MPDGVYERDVLAWSQHQADLLRRLARAGPALEFALAAQGDEENVLEQVVDVAGRDAQAQQEAAHHDGVGFIELPQRPGVRRCCGDCGDH